ncbi:hypothetical protein [Halochromatium sp.]
MPLKLLLEPTGPGRGLLSVQGLAAAPESVTLAIQRNDGRYLGQHGHWQPEPFWHPQFSVDMDARGLRIGLGSALMDGIIAMQGAPLMVALRLDGREDRGVVRVRGSLIGSNAAAPESLAPPAFATGDAEAPCADKRAELHQQPDQRSNQRPGQETDLEPDLGAEPQAPSSAGSAVRWPLLLGVVLLLLLATAGAFWFFQLPQRWLVSDEPATASTPASESESDSESTEPATTFSPSPESALTGVRFVVDYLDGDPSAQAMFAEAEARSAAGDCDAALLLYAKAAEADAALGLPVARLFDPPTYVGGGCIDAANEATALEYYRSAAETGSLEAMRRAGEIMMARAASGPLHEEGVDWLRRANAVDTSQEPVQE